MSVPKKGKPPLKPELRPPKKRKQRVERNQLVREIKINPETYCRIPAELQELTVKCRLSYLAEVVLYHLARFRGTQKFAKPSRERLALELGTTPRNITRAFTELTDFGIIKCIERGTSGGGGKPCKFSIPLIDELDKRLKDMEE